MSNGPIEFLIGEERIALSRLATTRLLPNGDLRIYLVNPNDIRQVRRGDEVGYAQLEIERAREAAMTDNARQWKSFRLE